jgi:ankyrin repeat protein
MKNLLSQHIQKSYQSIDLDDASKNKDMNILIYALEEIYQSIIKNQLSIEEKQNNLKKIYSCIMNNLMEINDDKSGKEQSTKIIFNIIKSNLYKIFEEKKLVSIIWLVIDNKFDSSLLSYLSNQARINNISLNSKSLNSSNQTILHHTILNNQISHARVIIREFCELINEQDMYGATALHYAVMKNNIAIIDLLLNSDNIDLSLKAGLKKETALDYAKSQNLTHIIKKITDKEEYLEKKKNPTWVERSSAQTTGGNREL